MSLRAVLEVGFCLARVKNVDLHSQGIYRVGVSLSKHKKDGSSAGDSQEKKRKNPKSENKTIENPHLQSNLSDKAMPYVFFENLPGVSKVNGMSVPDSLRMYEPAHADDVNHVYYSNATHIRYVDEERATYDGVQFRMEVDVLKERNTVLELLVSLERAEVDENARFSRTQNPVVLQDLQYEVLGTRKILLNYSLEGFHEYLPVIFDDCFAMGFALVETTIHACITSLRFERDRGQSLEDFVTSSAPDDARNTDGPLSRGDRLAQHAEHIRSASLFLLRSSYNHLSKCVELVLNRMAVVTSPTPAMLQETHLEQIQREQELEPKLERMERLELAPYFFPPVNGGESGRTLAEFCQAFSDEVETLSSKLVLTWYNFIQYLRLHGQDVLVDLKEDWMRKAKERVGESIIREKSSLEQFSQATSLSKQKERAVIATKIRESISRIRQFQKDNVEDLEMFEDSSAYPVMFEERYEGKDLSESGSGYCAESFQSPAVETVVPKHIIVLVHGFMGSSWDLRPFRNYISILDPSAVTLLSRANENDTDSDIQVLGFRLAQEIRQFIKEFLSNTQRAELGKLSFVCHSIGSVILRSALTQKVMEPYLGYLHAFVSLSSPHLGSRLLSSPLVKYGLLAMRYWRKATALSQLGMSDASDLRETLLYKLSLHSLNGFKHIFLVSSSQDQYVPYHSARIEPVEEVVGTGSAEELLVTKEMAANLLRGVDPSRVYRLDFSFQFDKVKTRKVDKLIGRAAHIRILDSPAMALILLLQYHGVLLSPK